MRFEVGEIITLDSNGKDYLVVKEVNYDNKFLYLNSCILRIE